MSVHCQRAFHLEECRSSMQTASPSHRYPGGPFQATRPPVKGRTTKDLTDPGVSLFVVMALIPLVDFPSCQRDLGVSISSQTVFPVLVLIATHRGSASPAPSPDSAV